MESPAGSDAADDCVAAAGFYGVPGESAAACGAGYYCPEGAEEQTACPANTDSPGDPPPPPPSLAASALDSLARNGRPRWFGAWGYGA